MKNTRSNRNQTEGSIVITICIVVFSFLAFVALLMTSVVMSAQGQDIAATLMSGGAVASAILALYRLYGNVGR